MQPILINGSPIPDTVQSALRSTLVAVFAILAARVFESAMVAGYAVAAFASFLTALPAIAAMAWGVWKAFKSWREKHRMAEIVPDEIAKVL